MTKIAVFDSGLGSLSVIDPIKRYCNYDIIYFADSENYPYGLKTRSQLRRIISDTIKLLQERFEPDLIIVGSNTPTLLLPEVISGSVIGVNPPLKEAAKKTKTKNVAILATQATAKSKELNHYIDSQKLSQKIKIHKIDSSKLVDLVETGRFLDDAEYCKMVINKVLYKVFSDNDIDVATLSSTHLPFLRKMLENQFPRVLFLDPAEMIVKKISKMTPNSQEKKHSLRIFTSGDPKLFQKKLQRIGIKNRVNPLS
ncbi:MAG: glutamate racemase [Nitrosopumilaceae archaeon]|nr:glutamate racemase [Nitrosopumilaceae archaeon]NIU01918.1 glutamate racemase [Nitrosopumilaceae archaeon]NIU88322.1 glutamate racemase [Nitrosopumilaceae archaeon]NIV66614.1 glutamate racemase [Nitrosopumilaceae archaeon]NIX62519.1 glutamate racemase [Nitrosopumilaceae archaeon]